MDSYLVYGTKKSLNLSEKMMVKLSRGQINEKPEN